MALVYKICPRHLWESAERSGVFAGAPVDLRDGYIHLSTAAQLGETAVRHFRGESDLLLVALDEARLGDGLRYERSRGGALFPHFYGALPLEAVAWVEPMLPGADGSPIVPGIEP